MKLLFRWQFLGIGALILNFQARATVVSLNPAGDAFVSSANPNSNYGGAGSLAISAAGLPKGEFQSLVKFNLGVAKATFDATFGAGGWMLDAVSLQLTATAPNNAIFNGNAAGPGGSNVNSAGQFAIRWMQNDTWIEGAGSPSSPGTTGISFLNLPGFLSGADEALGSYSFNGATSGSNTWALNLASSFAADVKSGDQVSLLLLSADGAVSYIANSGSAGASASRPVLVVSASAVPEPGTAAALACTALVILGRRRWNRHTRQDGTSAGKPAVIATAG